MTFSTSTRKRKALHEDQVTQQRARGDYSNTARALPFDFCTIAFDVPVVSPWHAAIHSKVAQFREARA